MEDALWRAWVRGTKKSPGGAGRPEFEPSTHVEKLRCSSSTDLVISGLGGRGRSAAPKASLAELVSFRGRPCLKIQVVSSWGRHSMSASGGGLFLKWSHPIALAGLNSL